MTNLLLTFALFAVCSGFGYTAEESRLEVGVAGATHPAGEQIRLQVTHINAQDRPITIARDKGASLIDGYVVELRGPDSKPVPSSAFVRAKAARAKNVAFNTTGKILTDVTSKENVTLDLLLSLYFDCTAEGEYNGSIRSTNTSDSDGKPVPLSGSFRFTVSAPR